MTQPTTIYFGADGGPASEENAPKVYLRALLFATSKRGRVVESMYVELVRNQSRQIFPIWVLGDQKLVRGSGLFVGETGVAVSHHFLMLKDGGNFRFVAGEYELSIYAKLLREETPILLFNQRLELSTEHAQEIQKAQTGVYYDWIPIKDCYHAHAEVRRPGIDEDILGLLRSATAGLKSSAN